MKSFDERELTNIVVTFNESISGLVESYNELREFLSLQFDEYIGTNKDEFKTNVENLFEHENANFRFDAEFETDGSVKRIGILEYKEFYIDLVFDLDENDNVVNWTYSIRNLSDFSDYIESLAG